jgi:hypothetical protein
MIAAIRASGNVSTVVGGYTTPDLSGAGVPLSPQQDAEVTIVSPNNRNARLTFHTATKTSGTFMIFQSTTDDETTSALVHDGSTGTLPLHLQRGVNYINIGLTAGLDVSGSAPVTVQLRDIRLR